MIKSRLKGSPIMKNPDRTTVSMLEDLPNIGKAMADDLRLIGIDHPRKLIGKDPFKMYDKLCLATGTKQDPCVIDVFMSVVHFMETGKPYPWWSFTDRRKNHKGFKHADPKIKFRDL
jgi:hypothetical protein